MPAKSIIVIPVTVIYVDVVMNVTQQSVIRTRLRPIYPYASLFVFLFLRLPLSRSSCAVSKYHCITSRQFVTNSAYQAILSPQHRRVYDAVNFIRIEQPELVLSAVRLVTSSISGRYAANSPARRSFNPEAIAHN